MIRLPADAHAFYDLYRVEFLSPSLFTGYNNISNYFLLSEYIYMYNTFDNCLLLFLPSLHLCFFVFEEQMTTRATLCILYTRATPGAPLGSIITLSPVNVYSMAIG